ASLQDELRAAGRWDRFGPGLALGQRIFQVISGGGGWGKKQGLLSLDTETQFSLTGEEDLESFIRSFHGQKGGDGEDAPLDSGVVAPGSTLQFFTTAVGELPEPRQADFSLTEHI
ncbi:hypothetical protein BN1723_020146, partial [Verticillium longisporum]